MMKRTLFLAGFLTLTLPSCGEGPRGPQGPGGATGSKGEDAKQVKIVFTRFTSLPNVCPTGSGVIITSMLYYFFFNSEIDEIQSSSFICDGPPGEDLTPSDMTIVGTITPCPQITTPYREVLLRLESGKILSSFSDNVNGKNTRLAFVPPGSYIDTDGSGCQFTVDANNTITDQYGNVFNP